MVNRRPDDEAPRARCPWAEGDELLRVYHDVEWGVPLRDERGLFELLVLEGSQAGLSWLTILRKRDAYREAFGGFDPERVSRFGSSDVDRLVRNPDLVRHRGKLEAAVGNARATLRLRDSDGGLASLVWSFVDGAPIDHGWRDSAQVPSSTPRSAALAGALRQRGFAFVGPTTCYSFMQAAGLVNDHVAGCFRHAEVGRG
ncbi:MAG: DNA-3-methyladenine glycosylase I [Candidatus Palauibacterales bacterium]|nr:DNA-3-methyladenine glycosylase I [Candidatus Palauibacterales bacterium]MDP2529228.1 DNA-3-methyladenine glycosylase I [Candidatus Palauibacterales bacterium]MDP2583681.1 DNA-3-methyladenine glycosylase I [Candidatus Palauibacterales bacterium]